MDGQAHLRFCMVRGRLWCYHYWTPHFYPIPARGFCIKRMQFTEYSQKYGPDRVVSWIGENK